jgi:hypothetical protein
MNYSGIPHDTTLEAARIQVQVLKRLSMEERSILMFELCATVRATVESGIRKRHPEYDDEQVRYAMMRLLWGEKLFREVYPSVEIRP